MSPSKNKKKQKNESRKRGSLRSNLSRKVGPFLGRIKKIDELWIAIVALAVVAGIAGGVFFSTLPEPITEVIEEIVTEEYRHPLTGGLVDEEYETLPQVFGVMIENSADAWPLTGLGEAFLVIEAPVEAGIPRFIAFYSEEDDVEKIGPVRSARPYYVDWNDSLQAIYTHVGGSPEALEQIAEGDTLDLNQFWYDEYFWRANGNRYAPHNVFTSTELLIEAMDEEFDLDEPSYEWWAFEEIEPADSLVDTIVIDFADGYLYDVTWRYGEMAGDYVMPSSPGRSAWLQDQDGVYIEPHTDNLVVMAMDIRTIDNIGRKAIETFSSGDALIFRRGLVEFVQWSLDDGGHLVFTSTSGEETPMQPGVTWIEVVDDLSQVSYE